MCHLKKCQWNFQTLPHWNPLAYFIFQLGLLPIYNFVTSYAGHLENVDALSYIELPNADTPHCMRDLKKSHHQWQFVMTNLFRKKLNIGKLSSLQ